MGSSTDWSRKPRRCPRSPSRRLRATTAALVAAVVASFFMGTAGPARAASAAFCVAPEYLFEVLRDWRSAKRQGQVSTKARAALAARALAVGEVARGRERYEALRFAASLDNSEGSAELLSARDRALERVIALYLDDGDIMGEFVLRVLRDDAHESALRASVLATTTSNAVRAACEFHAIEPVLDRALEDGEIAAAERERVLACLQRISERYADSKHPLSTKTWGELAAEFSVNLRDLVLPGEPAPEIIGRDLAGIELRLSALRGKTVLLCFWGDWCMPARALYPLQRTLAAHFAGRAFTILGVNSDPQAQTASAVIALEEMSWPNLWEGREGTGGAIATRWRIRAWPSWYLIDAQGVVRSRWRGAPAREELDRELDRWVPKLRR